MHSHVANGGSDYLGPRHDEHAKYPGRWNKGYWFKSPYEQHSNSKVELQKFVEYCFPAAFGFEPAEYWHRNFNPSKPLALLDDFQCQGKDLKRFEAWLKVY